MDPVDGMDSVDAVDKSRRPNIFRPSPGMVQILRLRRSGCL